MHRIYLLVVVSLIGCASHSHTSPNMPTEPAPLSVAPTSTAEPVEAVPERPHHPCVPVTDCRVVARHALDSPFARTHGFYESPAGLVASRRSGWEEHGRAEGTVFVEVTESCDTGTGFYIVSGSEIWLPFAESCAVDICTEDPAGWNFAYEAIEVPHDARNFRPLGHGFYDDGVHIFDRSETLLDDDVDRATFHACSAVPHDPNSATFYPCAEDSRGLFGYGEHGDVGRFRP